MVNTRVVIAGLVASMVMGMIEMVFEAVAGSGFWAPVTYISATILRGLQDVGSPVPFQFVPVVLGLMGHMMNSVILGVLFVLLIAPHLRSQAAVLVGGLAYGMAIFVLMWVVVLPVVDPVMLRLNGVVFLLSHMMWGAAFGAILGSRVVSARLHPQATAF